MSFLDSKNLKSFLNDWGSKSVEGSLLLGGISSMYLLELAFKTRIFLIEKTKELLNLIVKTEKTPLINVNETEVVSKVKSSIPNSMLILVPSGLTGMLIKENGIFFLESMNMILYQMKMYHNKVDKKNVYRMNPFFYQLYSKQKSIRAQKPLQLSDLSSSCLLHMILNDIFAYKQFLKNHPSRMGLITKLNFQQMTQQIIHSFDSTNNSWTTGSNFSKIKGFFLGYKTSEILSTGTKNIDEILLEISNAMKDTFFFEELMKISEGNHDYKERFFFQGSMDTINNEVVNLNVLLDGEFELSTDLTTLFKIDCFIGHDVLHYEGNTDLKTLWRYRGKLGYRILPNMF